MNKLSEILKDLEQGKINADHAETEILALFKLPRFSVRYRYLNRTDATTHEDEVVALSMIDACDKVCYNHNYEIEWLSATQLF